MSINLTHNTFFFPSLFCFIRTGSEKHGKEKDMWSLILFFFYRFSPFATLQLVTRLFTNYATHKSRFFPLILYSKPSKKHGNESCRLIRRKIIFLLFLLVSFFVSLVLVFPFQTGRVMNLFLWYFRLFPPFFFWVLFCSAFSYFLLHSLPSVPISTLHFFLVSSVQSSHIRTTLFFITTK